MGNKWVIGTAVGIFVGWAARTVYDSWRETRQLLKEGEEIDRETDRLSKMAEEDIKSITVDLDRCDPKFKEFCQRCYDKKNPNDAVKASIKLARYVGVPEDKILHNMEEVDKFFLE